MLAWWVTAALAGVCDSGPACHTMAMTLLDYDAEGALRAWLEGCETHSHARSCWKAGNLMVDGFRLKGDYDRSIALKERAFQLATTDCQASDAGCTTLGLAWYWGIGNDKDTVPADELLHLACVAGEGEACHWEAVLSRQCLPQFQGRYPFSDYCDETDDDQGVRVLLERSCELGWADGCNALGLHAAERLELPELAERAYARACNDLGDVSGCLRWSQHRVAHGQAEAGATGLGQLCVAAPAGALRTSACVGAAAATGTLDVVEQACADDGDCWHDMARVLRQGAHHLPTPQPELAKPAAARACALGVTTSCP